MVIDHGNDDLWPAITYKSYFVGRVKIRSPERLLKNREQKDRQIKLRLAYIKNSGGLESWNLLYERFRIRRVIYNQTASIRKTIFESAEYAANGS